MKRQVQAVVLLLLGGAVLRTGLTDAYLTYVKPGLRPFLIASAVVLIAIAAATLIYDLRRKPAAAPVCADGHDDDGHGHGEPRVAWLLVLPVLGLLLVAPNALGAYAADSTGTAISGFEAESDYPPLPEGDPAEISVLDYASRAVFDEGRSIGDRRVLLTGFISRDGDGNPYLTRMIVSCCAADARPIKVGLEGAVPEGLADDTWLQVVGRYSATVDRDVINGGKIPYIAVETYSEIEAPEGQYEN